MAHISWKSQKFPSISQRREQKTLALRLGIDFLLSISPHQVQTVCGSSS
jgi:hypothetical protein